MTVTGCAAFTLIELSIVLIIIGLLIGGVLVGRDLISAAEIRSQISQIEKYNTAVNTFKLKYGGLPGDLRQDLVTGFGFSVVPTRNVYVLNGGGNEMIENRIYLLGLGELYYNCCLSAEIAWFWEDLTSNSGLIEGKFSLAGTNAYPGIDGTPTFTEATNPSILALIPSAKISGNYVTVYTDNGINFFSLIAFGKTAITFYGSMGGLDDNGAARTSTGLTAAQSYNIDVKIDDGLPQTGRVIAKFQQWDVAQPSASNHGLVWASSSSTGGATGTAATPASATTCYDNGNVGGAAQKYSVGYNGGNELNCALSFRFQ